MSFHVQLYVTDIYIYIAAHKYMNNSFNSYEQLEMNLIWKNVFEGKWKYFNNSTVHVLSILLRTYCLKEVTKYS